DSPHALRCGFCRFLDVRNQRSVSPFASDPARQAGRARPATTAGRNRDQPSARARARSRRTGAGPDHYTTSVSVAPDEFKKHNEDTDAQVTASIESTAKAL